MLSVGIILSSSTVYSASFDLFKDDSTQLNYPPIDTQSFLNSDFSKQTQAHKKKKDYYEIVELIRKNQLTEAENKINDLVKDNPSDSTFLNLKALLAISKKDIDSAIVLYQKAIELNSDDIFAHIAIAKLYFEKNDLTSTTAYSKKALAINDTRAEPYILLAKVARKQNALQDAEIILHTALKKTKGNSKQEIAIAKDISKLYLAKKQKKKTLLLAQQIIDRYPTENSALSFLASAQLANNQKSLAIQSLKKLINQDKLDSEHRLILASLLISDKKKEKEKEIVTLLNEISQNSTNYSQTIIPKAAFFTRINHYQAALKTIKELDKFSTIPGATKRIEGNIYLHQHKHKQALLAYQQAYKLSPDNKTLFLIIDILSNQKQTSTAINLLKQELQKNNTNIAIHFKLATLYQQQGNLRDSELHYKAVITAIPDSASALNNLAWLYYEHNNSQALTYAEKAYKSNPNSADIADTYGTILIQHGKTTQAINMLKEAAKLAPTNFNIQYHLAQALTANNNHTKAIETLNFILKNNQFFSEKNAATLLLTNLKKK